MIRWLLARRARWVGVAVTLVLALAAAGVLTWRSLGGQPAGPVLPPLAFDKMFGEPGEQDTLERRPNLSLALGWTADNARLISRQQDGNIIAWDVANGDAAAVARTEAVFAFCAAEQRVLVNIGGDAVLLGLADGQFRKVSDGRHDHAAFSTDCSVLAIAREDENGIRLLRGDTWSRVATEQPVRNSLMLSRDGGFLAASGGTFKAEAGHGTVLEIFDLGDGSAQRTARVANPDEILGLWSMAFAADGSGLMMGSQTLGQSGVRHLDSRSGLVRWGRDGFGTDWIRALAVSPDGILLATGDERGRLRIWEVDSGVLVDEFSTGMVIQSLAFSTDGRRLAIGLWDGTIGIVVADQLIGH